MSEISLRLGELISEIDILDQAYDLSLLDAVALDQIELLDTAGDSAGDIHFRRLDHPDGLDRRMILGRPQVRAAEQKESEGNTGQDCQLNGPANDRSNHCGCTGLKFCDGSAPSDLSIRLPSSRLRSETGRLVP